MHFYLEDRNEVYANDMEKVVAINIPVGTVVEVAWRPRVGALAEDVASRGVDKFIGTVRENCTHYIRVWVDCPGDQGYMRAVNKVEIFTGEVVITDYMTGKMFEVRKEGE